MTMDTNQPEEETERDTESREHLSTHQGLQDPKEPQSTTQSVLDASPEELKKWRSEDPTLARARELAQQNFLPLQEQKPEMIHNQDTHLTAEQKSQLEAVASEFPSIFKSTPGRTSLVEHSIHVGDTTPVRQTAYRLPYSKRQDVRLELDKMLENDIIVPSTSAWASPVVLVPKKDGGTRFCVDYRRLNSIAKFDAYLMPRAEELFEQIGNAQFISTLDLTKGYWQIPWHLHPKK